MKKMLVLAMTMAMVLLAAAGVCETLRVGMECNYAPYNWTQSDASENAVAIAAGGYADGYDLECMTALRHTLKNRAVAALVALCRECARDDASEAALTAAYCRAYDAWLDAAAHGRGGFAREALEAVLFVTAAKKFH